MANESNSEEAIGEAVAVMDAATKAEAHASAAGARPDPHARSGRLDQPAYGTTGCGSWSTSPKSPRTC